jgi:hypothetical protein
MGSAFSVTSSLIAFVAVIFCVGFVLGYQVRSRTSRLRRRRIFFGNGIPPSGKQADPASVLALMQSIRRAGPDASTQNVADAPATAPLDAVASRQSGHATNA